MPTHPSQLAQQAAARALCPWTRTQPRHIHSRHCRRQTCPRRSRRRRPPSLKRGTTLQRRSRQLRRTPQCRLRRRHLPCRQQLGRRSSTARQLLPSCRRRRRPCWIRQDRSRAWKPHRPLRFLGLISHNAEPCAHLFVATCSTISRAQPCSTGGQPPLPRQRQLGGASCSTTSLGRHCSSAAPRAEPSARPAAPCGPCGAAGNAPPDGRP